MVKIVQSILYFPSITVSKVLLLVGITLAATLSEGFGVAMLFPVIDFIEKGQDFGVLAESSRMWSHIDRGFEILSLPKNLLCLMGVVFGLLMIRQVLVYLRTIYNSWITESIFADIRSEGFYRFALADIAFYDKYDVGQMFNVLTVDGLRAGGGIFTFFNLLGSVSIFILYFGFLLVLSPGMSLFSLVMMACIGGIFRTRFTRSADIGKEVSSLNEKISSSILERLSGIRLLKMSCTEEDEKSLVQGLSNRIRSDSYTLSKIRARIEFVLEPVVLLAGFSILYLSVEVFRMGLAETGMFIFVLLRLLPYTKDILKGRQSLAGFMGSLFRVTDLLEKAAEAHVIKGGAVTEIKLRRGITFKDVFFRYDRLTEPVLRGVSIFIPSGKMTALVGRSGAGKSTLVDLIPRFRVPEQGIILLDDLGVEQHDLRTLRRSIAYVSQEGFLFNDTIENNIRYGKPDATEQDVVEAARMAYAEEFIGRFPEGFKTVVGERGTKLSGGQKQRVILARALVQKAQIIILDEPTSSLDSESEYYIQKAIDRIREEEKITIIVIAHRLSTIKSADQIVVLDEGRVIECGSHKELMHEDRWYADMVRMQAAEATS